MIVDTHCHLDFEALQPLLAAEMAKCTLSGIQGFLIPGVKREFWRRQEALKSEYPNCRIALGLHPYYIGEHHLDDVDKLREWITCRKGVCAIGEIGLDKEFDRWDLQIELFRLQVRLASQYSLPILIHSRRAHSEILHLLVDEKFRGRGVVHGFSGSYELAREYWRKGIYIGVGGVITYPEASKTRAAISRMPLCSLLIETDAPSMPIYQQEGRYNLPSNIIRVLNALSSLRAEPEAVVRDQVYENSCILLGLNKW
ncbi:MAG: TatD family hydrolase [Hahellaceae bacterium]|nr:TatD family hydrolase [Hahellaceae bacterium]MCP5210782.1 TatD family hydrolase [Hahellaceae bacterium]